MSKVEGKQLNPNEGGVSITHQVARAKLLNVLSSSGLRCEFPGYSMHCDKSPEGLQQSIEMGAAWPLCDTRQKLLRTLSSSVQRETHK